MAACAALPIARLAPDGLHQRHLDGRRAQVDREGLMKVGREAFVIANAIGGPCMTQFG